MSRLASAISQLALFLSASLVVFMTAFILYEICLRTFFSRSTFYTEEMIGYMIAAMAFLGLGAAFRDGVIIRVGILQGVVSKSASLARFVELICCFLASVIVATATWAFARSIIDKYNFGYTSGTIADVPIWIPQSFVFAGLAVFLLQIISYATALLAGSAEPGLGAGETSPD